MTLLCRCANIYFYFKRRYSSTINRYIKDNEEIDIYIPELNIGIEYDGSFWHVINDSGKYSDYVTLFRDERVDINGDGKVEEWYVQSLAFSKHVVGMTGEQVANMETKANSIGYQMTTDEDLLKAGCTIQITAIKAVVAKSVANAR